MLNQKFKITVRQALIIFVLVTLSPAIRIFPQHTTLAENAFWTTPLISVIPLFILFAVLNAFFKNNKAADLGDVFELVLGKIAGKTLLAVYLSWVMLLFFLYIRYFAERLNTSIFPNTNPKFFIITILILVLIAAWGRMETFARFAELLLLIFTFVFIAFFLLLAPTVQFSNLYPVTYYDILPALKGSLTVISVWGYVFLIFFLGQYIFNKDRLKKYSKKAVWYVAIMTTLMLICTVGSLGPENVHKIPLPFFSSVKQIEFLKTFDRFEAALLSTWIVMDFIIITFFAKVIMSITQKLFHTSHARYFAFPVITLGYVGSLFIAIDRFELERLTDQLFLPGNVILFYFVPIIILAIGKIRKKI